MKAVNLLPGEQRGSQKTAAVAAVAPAPKGSAYGAYVVLGALAFAVIAVALYVLAGNTIKDRKAELAKVTQQAQATQARAKSLQDYADFKQLAAQRITTVAGLANSRFDWERTLDDLSRAIPQDVHLTSLSGSTSTSVGSGGSALRGAISAPALSLAGCAPSQVSVARLMAQLRDIRGVTRVALAKSDKDSSSGSGTASAPSGSSGGQLCPKGSPPSFDVVVFFEHAALGAGATPNLPAAGTAAATATTSSTTSSTTATTQGSAK
jgi:Tfp pilus assembly protein PilN